MRERGMRLEKHGGMLLSVAVALAFFVALAAGFGKDGAPRPEYTLPILALAEGESDFLHIILDMPDGTAYLSDGQTTNVADRLYFKESLTWARAIEYVERGHIGGTPRIILSVPVKHNGEIVGVVHGSYAEEDIRELLVSGAYGGAGRSFICNDLGDIIIAAEGGTGYESLAAMLENGAEKGEAQRVLEDMANGEKGKVTYSDGNSERYAVYFPLNIIETDANRWFIVNEVPEEVISKYVAVYTSTTLTTLALIAAAALLAIAFFVWREARNLRQLKSELSELSFREQQYRIVAQQSNKFIYRYDIKTRVSIRDQGDRFGKPQRLENVPESTLDLLAEESREDYLEFFRKICAGEPHASVVTRMREVDGSWRWMHSDATVIFGDGGEPVQAVVSYYDVTEQREKELLYQKWQQETAAISMTAATVIESNLTQNVTERVEGFLLERLEPGEAGGFNERAAIRARSVLLEDRAAFIETANRERLIGAFYDGARTHSLDYRMLRDGKTRWVNMTIQLAQYPDTNDIKAFIIITDIDERKRSELSVQELANTDKMTGALNRAAFMERASEVLEDENAETHALMILDVDDLKHINDSLGHQAGDNVLITLVSELRAALREQDLIGRIGGDEFMALLRNVSLETAEARAAAICQRLLRQLPGGVPVSVSIGVSLYPVQGQNLAALYKAADAALYEVKKGGKNGWRCRR